VEVPRVQGAADDGDGVAQGGAGVDHARVTAVSRRRGPTGAHGAAQRLVPGEAVQRRRAAGGWVPRQDCKRVGDCPPGYPTERRPRELNFRKPDVIIGTRDWETVERFLCNMEPDKIAKLRETRKHHVRIVLQSGERWYLNLLVSKTARQSRITLAAAAKLGRGSVHDKRMHLRDVNGMEVSISVDVVDTTKELLEGEDSLRNSQKPHMVLSPGDERRIKGMMLTWDKPTSSRAGPARARRRANPPRKQGRKEQGIRRPSSTSR
jgi:hypothetical protein